MPNDISCIIVDDEIDAINLLSSSLNSLYKNITIKGSFTFWEDALAALRSQDHDLVFMDISMPGKNGIDLLRLVPNLQSEVIFITAHEDYAIKAFEFSASGYIVKPFDDKALSVAIDKAIERISNKKIAEQHTDTHTTTKIGIPNSNGIDYVTVQDIVYLESIKNYTKITTHTGETLSSYNIGKFKSILNNNNFLQVHRSFIINTLFITRYASDIITMDNKKEIPLAKAYKDEFLQLFPNLNSHR